jgi:hypothetical protein
MLEKAHLPVKLVVLLNQHHNFVIVPLAEVTRLFYLILFHLLGTISLYVI